MPYGRPADNDPNAWYKAVQRIDQVRLANEAFQSVSRSAPSAPTKTAFARPPPLSVARLPPFHSFRSPQNLRCLLHLWESLWTSTRLEKQGPCLCEDVTDAET